MKAPYRLALPFSGLMAFAMSGYSVSISVFTDKIAEFINIPAAAISRRPQNLSAEEAAATGVPFVTAWSALDLAHLESGESVIVSGATGGQVIASRCCCAMQFCNTKIEGLANKPVCLTNAPDEINYVQLIRRGAGDHVSTLVSPKMLRLTAGVKPA